MEGIVRQTDFRSSFEALAQELRHVRRALRASPGVAVVAILTVAIGVGVATSMFGILRTLVFVPPPHVGQSERVFRLHQVTQREDGSEAVFTPTSFPFLELLQTRMGSIQAAGAYMSAELPVGRGQAARLASVTMVSGGFWRVMGSRPVLGRFIEDEEAHPVTGSRVVVLGHGYWRRQFGGSQNVLGAPVLIKGHPYNVIGVAPPGFRGVEPSDVDLWLPLFARGDGSDQAVTWHLAKPSFILDIAVRLRPGSSDQQASAEATSLYRAFLEDAYGSRPGETTHDRNQRARVQFGPVTGGLGSDLRLTPAARMSGWLAGTAFILLTIACSNLAGLLLMRAVRRRSEIAIKLALGVERRRLALQLFAESAVVTLLGGVGAIGVAAWSGSWLQRIILPGAAWERPGLAESGVLALALLFACAITCAAGMTPLWYARAHNTSVLRDSAIRTPNRRPRILTALLMTQGTLTVVLLVAAGLFVKSLRNASTEDVGLARDTLVARVDFAGSGRSAAAIADLFERALEAVRAIPGVVQASVATDAPLLSARMTGVPRLPGRPDLPSFPTGGPYVNAVTPGFFSTVGMHIVQGRDFVDNERTEGAIIVNETMARLYWPTESAVGKCLLRGRQSTCIPVVGVVADARRLHLVEKDKYLFYYVAMPPGNPLSRVLLVRKGPGVKGVQETLRRVFVGLDPAMPYVRIEALGEALEPEMRPWRVGASVFSSLGLLAASLALIGLFSSVSYNVSQRTREFATRMALGATRTALVGMVLRDGLRDGALAVAVGLVLAVAGGRYLESLLFGVTAYDSLVLIVISVIVLSLAACASLLPAWRVSGVDPADALRAD
jgi:putative ABC transport system permease protein